MRPRSRARAAALLALDTLLLLCGCFHKKKAAAPPLPVTPARLVLLPPNVPHDNQEVRWVSLAATVLMAKELVVTPEGVQVVLESPAPGEGT